MELLLDSQFFQMDLPSLQHWRSTVDNLMTHDKTTFKELMGKRNRHFFALRLFYLGMSPDITSYFFIVFISAKLASINQSGSLNLFSSKEIELEQRALLLKRLAFVIYCSNEDQYQKQVPDIQGTYLKNKLKFLCQNTPQNRYLGIPPYCCISYFREIS